MIICNFYPDPDPNNFGPDPANCLDPEHWAPAKNHDSGSCNAALNTVYRYRQYAFLIGSHIIRQEGFMPYGLGERICPGKELADMEMFLILANLLASYSLLLAPGDTGEMGTQVGIVTVSDVGAVAFWPETES